MPRFSDQFIHQVAQATDIVDLVSQYVTLKHKGKEFVGLCPFHDDKKPSLNVSPAKQIFKCFACGAGGGVFQFLVLYDKLSFPEAVRALADRAGIPLPQQSVQPQRAGQLAKNDLLEIMTFAADFFRKQLNAPVGAAALQYARDRGFTDEAIQRFGIGFAPESWDALILAGRAARISEDHLLAAGLVTRREGSARCYDRFRNRLIFPIQDLTGRTIAFGGRALSDQEQAKYLNSPETALFDKSGELFALNFSRPQIVASGQAVVVEGYLDALIPIQAGVDNVVATLGTALTERHVRLLRRYATEAVLVFDADVAGAAAAERALEIFLAQQLHVRVATIPAGKDPCDFVLDKGPDAFRAMLADAPDALHHVWTRRMEAYKLAGGNLSDRRRLVEEFLRLVVSSAAFGAIDEIRRGQLAQHIGHMLNVSASDLQRQMQRLARRRPRRAAATDQPQTTDHEAGPTDPAESLVLEILLNRPDLFDDVADRIGPNDFISTALRPIAEQVWTAGHAGTLALDELLRTEDLAAMGSLLTDLAAAGQRRGNFEKTLAEAVDHLLYRRTQGELEQLRIGEYDDETLRQITQALRGRDVRRRPRIS